jgi:hypothetical protein
VQIKVRISRERDLVLTVERKAWLAAWLAAWIRRAVERVKVLLSDRKSGS